jgi:hypothetical protein
MRHTKIFLEKEIKRMEDYIHGGGWKDVSEYLEELKQIKMTAEDLFGKHFNGLHYDDITNKHIEKYAIEYAEQKCKELLEIVAEKAEVRLGISSCNYVVDKDSILNAVNLKEFIR